MKTKGSIIHPQDPNKRPGILEFSRLAEASPQWRGPEVEVPLY